MGNYEDDRFMDEEEKKKVEPKFLDISLSYRFDSKEEVNKMIKAINAFVEEHNEGLDNINYNVLGYKLY